MAPPAVVAKGIYVIRSVRYPTLVYELQSDNTVRLATLLNPPTPAQLWYIEQDGDYHDVPKYKIQNNGNQFVLGNKDTVVAAGYPNNRWTLEPRNEGYQIGLPVTPPDDRVVDVSNDLKPFLDTRSGQLGQRWILDPYVPSKPKTPPPKKTDDINKWRQATANFPAGLYVISNVGTRRVFLIMMPFWSQSPPKPSYVIEALKGPTSGTEDYIRWSVTHEPSSGGLIIRYQPYDASTATAERRKYDYHSLTNGPTIAQGNHVVRLIPKYQTNAYFISADLSSNSPSVFADYTPGGGDRGQLTQATLNFGDTRQQWVFYPANMKSSWAIDLGAR